MLQYGKQLTKMRENLRSKAQLLLDADRANIDVNVDAVNKLSIKL